MNLKTMLYKMGTGLTKDMTPAKFVKAVVSCPIVTSAFPELGTIATTVQNLINGHETLTKQIDNLENTIKKQEELIDKTQSAINKATDVYTNSLNKVGAYTAPPLGGPCVPNPVGTPLQVAITTADNALEDAKEVLKSLEEELEKLKKITEKYYNDMIERVKGYIDSIANTKVS